MRPGCRREAGIVDVFLHDGQQLAPHLRHTSINRQYSPIERVEHIGHTRGNRRRDVRGRAQPGDSFGHLPDGQGADREIGVVDACQPSINMPCGVVFPISRNTLVCK
jgi:hypothetical protein